MNDQFVNHNKVYCTHRGKLFIKKWLTLIQHLKKRKNKQKKEKEGERIKNHFNSTTFI